MPGDDARPANVHGDASQLGRQDMVAIAKMQMELAERSVRTQERIAELQTNADVRRHGMACRSVCFCLFLVLAFCLAGLSMDRGDLALRMMDKLLTAGLGLLGGAGGMLLFQGRRDGGKDGPGQR